MNNMLRSLLDMISAVPAPGREAGSDVDPTAQAAYANPTDLGRVGGMHQPDFQLPRGPWQDNGLGSMEQVPVTDLGKVGGDPAKAPRLPQGQMVDNGRGSMVPAVNTRVAGIDMPQQYNTRVGGITMPQQYDTRMAGIDLQPSVNTRIAGIDMAGQPPAHQKAPVHLHLNEDVLKALIKHQSGKLAEDEGE